MTKIWLSGTVALLLAHGPLAVAQGAQCAGDNGGLSLPPGFCATLFADHIGHARHLAVATDGTVYVNTWSGRYFDRLGSQLPPGGFLVALRDSRGSGHADVIRRFGDGVEQGAHGGSGIALFERFLYAEVNDRIVRYALPSHGFVPSGKPQTVVSGLPLTGDHPMHPFVIDAKGNLFVDVASASNACGVHDRMPGSAGHDPCTELNTRGGVWRFDAHRLNQRFSPRERYATGIRNGEGMSFDAAGRLFVTQHGRDQLPENYPRLYDSEHGRELPAEEVVQLEQGGDYGWPTCYFDGFQKKLVLAPEYGGDGGRTQGICAQKRPPAFWFPSHWAPNDLLIYNGSQFPVPYRGGAFVAFHGSWNRAPAPQQGFDVVFQPLEDGRPSGDYIVFADGFAGPGRDAGHAVARPGGLAMGPDGSLYVAEDVAGRIWRITYSGPAQVALQAAPAAVQATATEAVDVSALPLPPGATREQLDRGAGIFRGAIAGGTCSGCHGIDGKGSNVGPSLATGEWLWSDGSWSGIAATIRNGVDRPKKLTGAMPPRGGAALSDADVEAVAAYAWALGHAVTR